MKNDVKLRAYAEGNLGDDLFIEIICGRYPNTLFRLCGKKKFESIYKRIPNLQYYAYDTITVRVLLGIRRKILNFLQPLLQSESILLATDLVFDNYVSRKSTHNVFITGSGFMNSKEEKDNLKQKFNEEVLYYDRRPFVLGCNFGPYYYKEYYEQYLKLFANVSDLCFRDHYSASLFSSLNIARCEADIVFSYPIDSITYPNLIEGAYILISVCNLKKDKDKASEYCNEYIHFLIRGINHWRNSGYKIVLMGFSKEQGDNLIISQILEQIADEENIFSFCYPQISVKESLSLIKNSSLVIATRYHAMILGLLFQKQTLVISYNEKTEHVIKDISPSLSWIKLNELSEVVFEENENTNGITISSKINTISDLEKSKLVKSAERQFILLDTVLNR